MYWEKNKLCREICKIFKTTSKRLHVDPRNCVCVAIVIMYAFSFVFFLFLVFIFLEKIKVITRANRFQDSGY